MISNQVLKSTIDGLKGILHIDFIVLGMDGRILARTEEEEVDFKESVDAFLASPADSQEMNGYHFYKVFDELLVEYVLVSVGSGDESYTAGKLAAFQLQTLLIAYRERFDKDNFVKNLLLDNLLLVDIYNRSQKLNIETSARRIVVIAETSLDQEVNSLEQLKDCFKDEKSDFVTAVDEKCLLVIHNLSKDGDYDEVRRIAEKVYKLFNPKDEGRVKVAYGTIVGEIRELSRSYKEAKLALDVGKIFVEDGSILAYSELGIGRLIYQLPVPLCKMFIKEIFGDRSPDEFDEETLVTIDKFFENSLNVSETSRQLFIHRNTLVYRLDKLQKATGLDLRIFDHAIIFKIAMMVVRYMKYMENE